jgi:hypothetical protein
LCTKKKLKKGVGIKSMGTQPTCEKEMERGVGIELGKTQYVHKEEMERGGKIGLVMKNLFVKI